MSATPGHVAALFVETDGVYFHVPRVHPWDVLRDARKYDGPHPVVAHPPCQLWVNFAGLNFKRYGGAHNRPGNDGGCFAAALAAVRAYGGVLEHPAGSFAWPTFNLVPPMKSGWLQSSPTEWTCEVWQSAYGHAARKRTWLFYASPEGVAPAEMDWTRTPGTAQVGWFDRIKPTVSKAEASRTPIAFRDALLALAAMSRKQDEERAA
jgi:hypothetical protein